MSFLFTLSFVVGVVAAILFVVLLRLFDSKLAQQLCAVGLFTAALIYVGFAGLNHGVAHMGLEVTGLVIFGGLSLMGARRWPLLLGLAWLAHGGWDFWHAAHPSTYVPLWWPAFCVGFDWVVGAYLLSVHFRKKQLVTAPAKSL